MASTKQIISNPNGVAFQERYVSLGRKAGKDLLRNDCKQLNIRIPMSGLTVIEKGYSRKARISYANNDSLMEYHLGGAVALGNESQKMTVAKPPQKTISEKNAEYQAKLAKEKEELRKKKVALIAKKKQEKEAAIWEKQKEKMASLESWEDF